MRERKFGRRVGIASLVAVCAVAAFAVIGGTGLAQELANPGKAQYGAGGQYHGKVTICHKQHVTIRVAMVAWFRAHQRHGDSMGPCSAAALKAAKTKAAKVKAAKIKAKQSQVTKEGTATTSSTSNGKAHGPKAPKHTSSPGVAAQPSTEATSGSRSGNGNSNGTANGHGKHG